MIRYNEVISRLGLRGARDHTSYEKMRATWIEPSEAIPDEMTCESIWNEIKVDLHKTDAIKRLHRQSLLTLQALYRSQNFDYKVENAMSGVYDSAKCQKIMQKHRSIVNEFRRIYYEQKAKIEIVGTITEVDELLVNTRFPKFRVGEEQL